MQHRNNVVTFLTLLTLFVIGCAKERELKPILPNGKRIPVSTFDGTFLFQKTITSVKYAGKESEGTPIGAYELSNQLVQFEAKEKSLDVVAIDPLFKEEKAALKSTLLASFAARHVDVLRKQNADGQETHEEEETETRRPWEQRSFVIVDPTKDIQDSRSVTSDYATTPDSIELDAQTGAINMDVSYQLKDNTQITLRYSFLKYQVSETYTAMAYPDELATRFGFFSTTTLKFDKYGRILESEAKKSTVINRWDTNKKIIYYLSKDFPDSLKPIAQNVFAEWNKSFKAATGQDVLELKENSGQGLGDLRYSMIYYDPSVDASHGILGYGPSFSNPRTGEILKGDVILYGGVLKTSIYRERLWDSLLGDFKGENTPSPATPEAGGITRPMRAGLSTALTLANGSFISKLKALPAADRDLVKMLKQNSVVSAISTTRAEMLKDHQANITRLNEDILGEIKKGVQVNKLTDEELEAFILTPLLTHELGHNWGLRHNFMGSTDLKHFGEGAQTSSVMDYVALTTHEAHKPAPYDNAAIQIGYGSNAATRSELLNKNYYYCSDEEVMSSQTALCNHFDLGSNLTEIAKSHLNRYVASWMFNNLRNDSPYFNTEANSNQYRRGVRAKLIPLRLAYDHADAMIRAGQGKSLESLWTLARQRIEADNESDPKNVLTIKVSTGMTVQQQNGKFKVVTVMVERKIDVAKIPALVADAKMAKNLSYSALLTIISNASRADYSSADQVHGELQLRGVLYDKLFALQLSGSQTTDPLGTNSAITLFSSSEGGDFKSFLASILSDTLPVATDNPSDAPTYDISTFDPNLRELALDLLATELAVPGSNAQARKLIELVAYTVDKNSDAWKQESDFHAQQKDLLKQLLKGDLTDKEATAVGAQLSILQSQRNRSVNIAMTRLSSIGDQYLVAPTVLPDLGLETASGHLIRDNINQLEDMITATKELTGEYKAAVDAEMKKPEKDRNQTLILDRLIKADNMGKTMENLSQFAENERLFLDRFYRLYTGR